jgi:CubicO group peptidase (beta-lactamase class C family)
MRPFLLPVLLMLLIAPMAFSTASAQVPASFNTAWADIRNGYTTMVRDSGIVGSSLLFMHDGEVLAWETVGLADLETQRPVDEETIYHWASITKTFTGIAIMQLRDRGLLSLDDPIVDYLPELKAAHNPYGEMDAITLRHLMSHSAGFRSPTWPWGGDKDWHPHEPTEWSQLVAMMPYTEIEFEPDSKYHYSNPGIIFLGRVIEQLTGEDYEVYIDKNLFKPLAMTQSYFDRTPYHLLKNRSNNYYIREGKPVANGLDFDTGITVSNGGLNAPLGDMAKYLAFLMGTDDPDQQALYDGLLARASLEEMWQVRHAVAERGPFQESVGLLFHVMERDGFRVVGHTGSQQAFRAFFYVDPAARTAAIAAFNTVGWDEPPDTRTLMEGVRADLFETIFPLF